METPDEILKKTRKQQGLTLQKLGAEVGIDFRRLSEYERAVVRPDLGGATRLAHRLALPVWKLLEPAIPWEPNCESNFRQRTEWEQPRDRPTQVRIGQAYKRYPDLMRYLSLLGPAWGDAFLRTLVCDSAEELLGWQHALTLDVRPGRVRPQMVGFDAMPVRDPESKRAVGHRHFPCLAVQNILLIPQLPVYTQGQYYRLDAAVKVGKVWVNLEIDGPGHDTSKDFIRASNIDLPSVRFGVDQLIQRNFADVLIATLGAHG
jgi:transcriptional regulator with XRE-family HTH domain